MIAFQRCALHSINLFRSFARRDKMALPTAVIEALKGTKNEPVVDAMLATGISFEVHGQALKKAIGDSLINEDFKTARFTLSQHKLAVKVQSL